MLRKRVSYFCVLLTDPDLRVSGFYYVPQPLSRFQQFSSRIEMRALSLRVRAHSLEHRKHDLPGGFPLSNPFSRNKPYGERAGNDVLLFHGSKLQHHTHGFLSYQSKDGLGLGSVAAH